MIFMSLGDALDKMDRLAANEHAGAEIPLRSEVYGQICGDPEPVEREVFKLLRKAFLAGVQRGRSVPRVLVKEL